MLATTVNQAGRVCQKSWSGMAQRCGLTPARNTYRCLQARRFEGTIALRRILRSLLIGLHGCRAGVDPDLPAPGGHLSSGQTVVPAPGGHLRSGQTVARAAARSAVLVRPGRAVLIAAWPMLRFRSSGVRRTP